MRLEITVKWSVGIPLHPEIVPHSAPDDGEFRIFPGLKEGFGSPFLSVHGNKWYG